MTQARSPTPSELLSLRAAYGLTQTEIGALLYANNRTWRQWELGLRRMHPVYYELLRLKLMIPSGNLSLPVLMDERKAA